MEGLSALALLQVGAQFGIAGLVLVLWFLTDRSKEKMLRQYREDTQAALEKHEEHMQEIRRMYESNARLVKAYDDVSKDLHDVVIINTQTMQMLCEEIKTNQYCPAVRINEKKKGKQ